MLALRAFGAGPPVIALHGFTHTARQFETVAALTGRTFLAIDLPGHGGSGDAATDHATVVDSIVDTTRTVTDRPIPCLGYSQGARLALSTAIDHGELFSCLVLVSGTAGIADAAERRARRDADAALADRIRTGGIDAFLERWTSTGITSTLHRPSAERAADIERRRENTVDGLARAVVGYGQGAMPPLWDRLEEVRIPSLLVVGEFDDRYTAIARAMARRMPDADVAVVAGARHDPIGDDPAAVAETVSAFVDRFG